MLTMTIIEADVCRINSVRSNLLRQDELKRTTLSRKEVMVQPYISCLDYPHAGFSIINVELDTAVN